MIIAVVDYGMGNLASVRRALEICGAEAVILESPRAEAWERSSGIVLPGVGAFRDGMEQITSRGWLRALRTAVRERQIPLLGICLGMQLLADRGMEGGDTPGLGFIAGEVGRLTPREASERVPHVGWNEVHQVASSDLLRGVEQDADFYFVHSYAFRARRTADVAAVTPYAGGFPSVVASGGVWGTQFHPEKSSSSGFKILNNFLRLTRQTRPEAAC